ncbi:MAG: diguanylate cyclase [Myxococcota bacterium]|nr:diguanylate cyclase [Myxococcota bacterium]
MRILIADDDAVSRLILSRTLQTWGYSVEQVDNGDDAYEELMKPDAPTLAIVDWMMPGMDGPEVCAAIRAEGPEPYRYMILLTARTETEDLVHGLSSGADDFLSKPFNQEELKARLRAGQRILNLQSQLIEAREALRYQATRDALTGVLNRATLMQKLREELDRTDRNDRNLGVAIFDLDHFKSINDTFGHLAGDEVLREVTRRVGGVLRHYDAVGRYGGEEFVCIFPDTTADGLFSAAERVRKVIAKGPVMADGALIPVTASLGVAITADPCEPESLLGAADAALYRAKESGRNRVELAFEVAVPLRKAS